MKRVDCSQGTCHFHFVRHFQFAMLPTSLGISSSDNTRSNDINIILIRFLCILLKSLLSFFRVHCENSLFESKKHFFDIRSKKNFFILKKVLLIQKNFL